MAEARPGRERDASVTFIWFHSLICDDAPYCNSCLGLKAFGMSDELKAIRT